MEKKQVPSKGIPSDEAFWLPYYKHVKPFQDDNENPTRNLFSLEEILMFLFPTKYRKRYYEIALLFMNFLKQNKGRIASSEIGRFVKENNIPKATLYNKIIPRLRKAGMIKLEREPSTSLKPTKKGRKMLITISKTFGNYLMKIADSWLAIVDDIRLMRREDHA